MIDYTPNKEEKIAGTVVLVEANSNETSDIWERFAKDGKRCKCTCDICTRTKRYPWTQITPGYWETIGKLDNRPVCVSIFWVRISGYLIAFWEVTSQVVDYVMVNDWLEKTFPKVPTANAMNFHNAIRVIQELKKKKE